jgi:minor extracellular serine protease Vpr
VGTVQQRRAGRILGCGLLALALTLPVTGVALADDTTPAAAPDQLTLVTLDGAGTSAGRRDVTEVLARQDAVLAAIGAGEPVYRWTTALNGFAAPLTDAQLAALDDQPGVAAVEADTVRPLAGRTSLAAVTSAAASPRLRGGAAW